MKNYVFAERGLGYRCQEKNEAQHSGTPPTLRAAAEHTLAAGKAGQCDAAAAKPSGECDASLAPRDLKQGGSCAAVVPESAGTRTITYAASLNGDAVEDIRILLTYIVLVRTDTNRSERPVEETAKGQHVILRHLFATTPCSICKLFRLSWQVPPNTFPIGTLLPIVVIRSLAGPLAISFGSKEYRSSRWFDPGVLERGCTY